jgi:catalase
MAKQAKTTKTETAKHGSSAAVTVHDQQLHRGTGGELHQYAEDGHDILTTAQGG